LISFSPHQAHESDARSFLWPDLIAVLDDLLRTLTHSLFIPSSYCFLFQAHESDARSFLSPDLIAVLDDAATLEREFKTVAARLDFLRGVVTDLFVDKHKLRGERWQLKMARLRVALGTDAGDGDAVGKGGSGGAAAAVNDDFNFDALVAIFRE
jgi:hypothetical protein